jgi:hypothetical protein
MGLIYVINSSEFEPISFGDNYLYHQYDKIASFLLKNYGQEYQQILAKPVLNNGVVNWHANYDMQLSRIGDLSQDKQVRIKKAYWELKNRLNQDIDDLEYSSLPEKKKWGSMLRQVFDDENNIILSDGEFWCLLWGWKFRNKTENYLPPEFASPNLSAPVVTESVPNIPYIPSVPSPLVTEVTQPITPPSPLKNTITPNNGKIKGSHFWYKVKRFFRNFVYRYWGLLLLILLLLILFCLFKNLTTKDCPEFNELNNQLDSLNNEIKNRCSKP